MKIDPLGTIPGFHQSDSTNCTTVFNFGSKYFSPLFTILTISLTAYAALLKQYTSHFIITSFLEQSFLLMDTFYFMHWYLRKFNSIRLD